jgi:hypothetical protein
MSEARRVYCHEHGERRPTFVCHHLVRGHGLGFYTPSRPRSRDESNERSAWCGECERVRQEQGAWNDVSEGYARVTMICDSCFEAARLRNQLATSVE